MSTNEISTQKLVPAGSTFNRREAIQGLAKIVAISLSVPGCGNAGGTSGVTPNGLSPGTGGGTGGSTVVASAGIAAVVTDRAAYAPGGAVSIRVTLSSTSGGAVPRGVVEIAFRHLGVLLPDKVKAKVALQQVQTATVQLSWVAPAFDFKGYALEVSYFRDDGSLMDFSTSAIDVSSDWRKFPRYGYLSDYSGNQSAESFISPMNARHINAIQFYDWQWKHHQPVKGDPANPDSTWPEVSNKTVKKAAVGALIDAAHDRGMVALQYNLIYGAGADFASYGVDPAWGLYETSGGAPWRFGPFPAGWTTPYLYIFNPANPAWQNYILDREMEVFKAFAFDGWHSDTVGDWGPRFAADGTPVDIKTTFQPFIQAARARLGTRPFVMNVVGAKGHEFVNASPIDVAYMEIWPWDGFPDYKSLKDIVDVTRHESGGKSLVVPAYMNYEYAKTKSDGAPGQFNVPGVLLTEATVMAAGGVRFELGDGDRMLCNEYFPNRSLVMSDTLQQAMRRYWDFLVAHQNLLRDGQENVSRKFASSAVALSDNGAQNTVWAFAKQGNGQEVMHFINLMGVKHINWRDELADQTVPAAQRDLPVKVYIGVKANQAYFASPDHEGGRAIELALTRGRDTGGDYVSFTLPQLSYWSMVWMGSN